MRMSNHKKIESIENLKKIKNSTYRKKFTKNNQKIKIENS